MPPEWNPAEPLLDEEKQEETHEFSRFEDVQSPSES